MYHSTLVGVGFSWVTATVGVGVGPQLRARQSEICYRMVREANV